MFALSIQQPFEVFTDIDGQPLDNGNIWIGQENMNPMTNPAAVYFDAGLTIPAAQPIKTINGYPSNNGSPAIIYINTNYSILVTDKNGSMVFTRGVGYVDYIGVSFDGVETLTNKTISGPSITTSNDSSFHGVLVGTGAGNINSNTVLGANALSSNTTGSNNTASGKNALYFNTTGSNNTASGSSALYNNTTGITNTASGKGALYSNTTGSNNTASGSNALFSNTTGIDNTASGATALYSNTTGSNNTASGANALSSNTTGGSNTASGQNALYFNTTGSNNTASGSSALYNNTEGSSNTASGQNALYNNTTGGSNTASGQNALYNNTTGYNNTASGKNALYNNTTGYNNTAIGLGALINNTTGASNTALGSQYTSGNIYSPAYNCTTESNRVSMAHTGVTNAYIQVAWTVVSDARDKTDFAPVPHGLDFVTKLKPIAYRFRETRGSPLGHGPFRYGFKAQDILELEGAAPVIVDADDPDKLRFNDQNLIAVLTIAIQELKAEFDAYKSTHP